jgi:hypothetical protein
MTFGAGDPLRASQEGRALAGLGRPLRYRPGWLADSSCLAWAVGGAPWRLYQGGVLGRVSFLGLRLGGVSGCSSVTAQAG